MTLASLKLVGMFPVVLMELKRVCRGLSTYEHASEYTAIRSPSGPAAEVLLVLLIASLISLVLVHLVFFD